MNQTEARQMAKELNEDNQGQFLWIADTPQSRSGRKDDAGRPDVDWGVRKGPFQHLWLEPSELRHHLGLS